MTYFRHYKGGIYRYFGNGKVEANPEQQMAIYLCPLTSQVWLRPADEFFGEVDGARRFQPVHEAEAKKQLRRERRGLLRG